MPDNDPQPQAPDDGSETAMSTPATTAETSNSSGGVGGAASDGTTGISRPPEARCGDFVTDIYKRAQIPQPTGVPTVLGGSR